MENLHIMTVESKRRITVTEAKEVLAFSDKEIRLKLKDGSFLNVYGDSLKITAFDDVSGVFSASGTINGTKYKQGINSFVKKVFR